MTAQFYANNYSNSFIYNKCPDEFIQSFCSLPLVNDLEWVSAKFSPHPQQEHIFVLGNEFGSIALLNAKEAYNNYKFIRKGFPCVHSVILDFCFLPGIPDWLVALSGNSHIYLLDITNGKPIYYLSGHSCSVRCVSVWPENPNLLVSGSRDGSILGWDLRSPTSGHMTINGECLTPSRTYVFAHESMEDSGSCYKRSKTISSITSLLHFGEHYVISSSSSASSGIRIWDLRYVTGAALRTLNVPQEEGGKEAGITSMCWDRFNSSFFASCTDNKIHEYLPSSNINIPVLSLNGQGINSFYVQCAVSPISDHLICGSSRDRAFIWDLQENRKYRQNNVKSCKNCFLPNPKFSFKGFENEFESVQWSQKGNYFLTLGRDHIRLWSHWNKNSNSSNQKFYNNQVPLKFDYPALLQPINKEIQPQINKNNNSLNLNIYGQRTPNNLKTILADFPSIYFPKTSFLQNQLQFFRTPKKIVLKGNTTLTPACKISRIEGNENQHRTPGRARNLSAAFQNQRTPGSSGKKKRCSPKFSNQRSQKQNNRESTSSSNTTPTGILKYLSPVENKK